MKCCICKGYFNPKRNSHFYFVYQAKSGRHHYKRWCAVCDANRQQEIDKLYDKFNPDLRV